MKPLSSLCPPRLLSISKLDVKSAVRQIPVRPHDWHLLGILWQGKYYYDRILPFGLRSSPTVFDAVVATIEWIMSYTSLEQGAGFRALRLPQFLARKTAIRPNMALLKAQSVSDSW